MGFPITYNPHKDMILTKLWLTTAELKSIKATIEDYKKGLTGFVSNISEVIINADARGDFIK